MVDIHIHSKKRAATLESVGFLYTSANRWRAGGFTYMIIHDYSAWHIACYLTRCCEVL